MAGYTGLDGAECNECPEGKYKDGLGSSNCENCPAGEQQRGANALDDRGHAPSRARRTWRGTATRLRSEAERRRHVLTMLTSTRRHLLERDSGSLLGLRGVRCRCRRSMHTCISIVIPFPHFDP